MGWADRAPLRGLTIRTDGPPVVCFPQSVCNACVDEFANRTNLHKRDFEKRLELAALPALVSRERLAVGDGVS